MTSVTPPNATEGAAASNAQESAAATHHTLWKPRVPKVFHGSVLEDVEDWLAQFERVSDYNGWTDFDKMRNTYFSLKDGARTWYENREPFPSWSVFRRYLLASWANPDRRERAERAIQSRLQMREGKEQLFAGLVRCPPKTVAEFSTEATCCSSTLLCTTGKCVPLRQ